MESPLPHVLYTSEHAPVNGNSATPFSQQPVVLTKQAYIKLTWQAHYWPVQYEQLVERDAARKAEIAAYQATIRDLTQRLYGTKSEKATRRNRASNPKSANPRKRGSQPGSPGHGRRDRSTLSVVEEVHTLSATEKRCPVCGKVVQPFPGPEVSTVIEVQGQAHVRRIRRQRYHKVCPCPQVPGLVTAPRVPRLIPKSPLGVSVWTEVVLDKYLYGRPTSRLCQALQHHGVPFSQGTVTEGLRKLPPLFEPVVRALRARQMGEKLFHGVSVVLLVWTAGPVRIPLAFRLWRQAGRSKFARALEWLSSRATGSWRISRHSWL